MIHIKEAIVVEGKYDHMRLAGLVDALIVETGALISSPSGKSSICSGVWPRPGVC